MATSASQLSILRTLRKDTGVQDLSLDASKTIAAIDARYSFPSSRQALATLRKEYPATKEFLEEIQERGKIWKKDSMNQQPTEKQVDAYISWEHLLEFRDMYYDEMTPVQRILMALYTYIPPVRLDYTPMQIVSRKPKTLKDGMNYLVQGKKPYFLFHAYKTHATYGDKAVLIPAPLKKELDKYIVEGQTYLFEDKGEAWTDARLSQNIQRIFKQFHNMNTSATMFRHAYATKFHRGQKPLSELTKTAEAMMHSPMQSMGYRFLALESVF